MLTIDPDALRDNAAQASQLLKALSHPDRLMLLCRLAEGERSVSELEPLVEVYQPSLSQQLGILRAPTIEEAFEWAATLATQPLPRGLSTADPVPDNVSPNLVRRILERVGHKVAANVPDQLGHASLPRSP